VLRQMELDREGKTSIVILDACRDNPLSRNLARSMGTRSAGIGRGLAAASTGLGTFIAYSTQPGNVALDGDGRNSPFTTAMVKHIGTVGRNLPATMIEVRKDVVAATNGRQVPWDHSALTGDFYFLPDATNAATPAGGGTVVSASAGASGDVAALQARLAKLEADAKDRDAAAKSATANLADTLKLAELRTRLTNYEEMNRDLQRRLMDMRRQELQTTDPNEKTKLSRNAMNLQMEWSRIGQSLRKTREDIAALEGTSPVTTASTAIAPAAAMPLPVTPKATSLSLSSDFEVVDNVRLLGTEIRSLKTPSPVACREVCEKDSQCVGFQHGRKIENMGVCGLFSRIDERREDVSWRSGIRSTETPTSKAN
jgi:Caspase domain